MDQVPEQDRPATLDALRERWAAPDQPGRPFFETETLEQLAERQGVAPVADFDSLRGDFWPEDESVDDLIAAIRVWRHEGE